MSIKELIRISNYCCLPGCLKIVLGVDDHVTRFYASCIGKIINILGNFWINVPLYANTVVSNSDPHVGGMKSQEILLMREVELNSFHHERLGCGGIQLQNFCLRAFAGPWEKDVLNSSNPLFLSFLALIIIIPHNLLNLVFHFVVTRQKITLFILLRLP